MNSLAPVTSRVVPRDGWRIHWLPEQVFFQEGPGLREWQWTSSGMKVVNGRNILQDGSIDLSNTERFISMEEFERRYSHFAVEAGDIFVTSSGTIGKVGRITNNVLPLMMNTSVIRFHPKPGSDMDADYLYAFLRSALFQEQIATFAIGAAQSNFGPAHLKRTWILSPPLPVQRKIAAILSAYDDLIENNTRRIAILEEMARSLYREWFVNFRFPGHEGRSMVDSPVGPIPEGWAWSRLGQVLELAYGKALKESDRRPGSYPVYGSSGLVGTHVVGLVRGPGIIVGRKGNVGSVFWSDKDFWPIDTVYYVVTDLNLAYLYYNLQTQNFINNDAAVPGLNRNQAYALNTLIPDRAVLDQFECHVKPLFGELRNLRARSKNLRYTRDLLLPKLIAGELDVSDLSTEVREE